MHLRRSWDNSGIYERADSREHFGCVRTHFQAFMNPIFSYVGLSIFRRRYLRRHLRKCSRMRPIVPNHHNHYHHNQVHAAAKVGKYIF